MSRSFASNEINSLLLLLLLHAAQEEEEEEEEEPTTRGTETHMLRGMAMPYTSFCDGIGFILGCIIHG
jgi:hypothetical protein